MTLGLEGGQIRNRGSFGLMSREKCWASIFWITVRQHFCGFL